MGKVTGIALPHIKNEQGQSHSDLPWALRSYAPRGHLQAPWEGLGPEAWVQAIPSSGEVSLAQSHGLFYFKNADEAAPFLIMRELLYILCISFKGCSATEGKLTFFLRTHCLLFKTQIRCPLLHEAFHKAPSGFIAFSFPSTELHLNLFFLVFLEQDNMVQWYGGLQIVKIKVT